jgi:Mrp family chromosome partitioning ATPase
MFKRNRSQSTNLTPPPLTVANQYGDPLMAFAPDAVESLRHMITRLGLQESLPTRLVFTSALRQEGVTYTARALAAILANDLLSKVCLVEMNWWWPSADLAHLSINGGLAAVVLGTATLDEAIVPTGRANLSLLPAGPMPMLNRPVAARSATLKETIEELARRFDHLIMDVPAVLATSDALALAALGGPCCFVIRQGVTSVEKVRAALDDIQNLPMLGVVMNRTHIATPASLMKFVPQD